MIAKIELGLAELLSRLRLIMVGCELNVSAVGECEARCDEQRVLGPDETGTKFHRFASFVMQSRLSPARKSGAGRCR